MAEYYTRKHPKRVPVHHDARTIPLKPARFEDEGRYFRCWHCGFICDVKRDALGGPEDRAGTTTEFYLETLPDTDWIGYLRPDPLPNICRVAHHSVLMNGNPQLTYEPKVERGCPMCGSLNYRGDYR